MLDTLSTYAFPPTGIACYYHTASVRNALDILEWNHLFGSLPSRRWVIFRRVFGILHPKHGKDKTHQDRTEGTD